MLTIKPYRKRKLLMDPEHVQARLAYKRKRQKMSNMEKNVLRKTRKKWVKVNKHQLEQKAEATRRVRKAAQNLID